MAKLMDAARAGMKHSGGLRAPASYSTIRGPQAQPTNNKYGAKPQTSLSPNKKG